MHFGLTPTELKTAAVPLMHAAPFRIPDPDRKMMQRHPLPQKHFSPPGNIPEILRDTCEQDLKKHEKALKYRLFEISDIYKTEMCPLAKVMRRELKAIGVKHLKVLYSKEPPITPPAQDDRLANGRQPVGSISFVPSVAGLLIAGEVIKDIMESAGK